MVNRQSLVLLSPLYNWIDVYTVAFRSWAYAFGIVRANRNVCAVATDPWSAFEHIERLDHMCEIVLKSGVTRSAHLARSLAAEPALITKTPTATADTPLRQA